MKCCHSPQILHEDLKNISLHRFPFSLLNLTIYLNLCGPPNSVSLCFLCVSGQEEDGRKVLVLSYPQYCRFRSVLVRLREQPSSLTIDHTVLALGGIAALGGRTSVLYCRDTFEHAALLKYESICDEFGEFCLQLAIRYLIISAPLQYQQPLQWQFMASEVLHIEPVKHLLMS